MRRDRSVEIPQQGGHPYDMLQQQMSQQAGGRISIIIAKLGYTTRQYLSKTGLVEKPPYTGVEKEILFAAISGTDRRELADKLDMNQRELQKKVMNMMETRSQF